MAMVMVMAEEEAVVMVVGQGMRPGLAPSTCILP